uniref:CRAL-TRIO domain-containing protein n=1 Tax=Rhabditophanes sp. KR3021 TaxID=114890 RepID=A0AC35U5W3_9BILA
MIDQIEQLRLILKDEIPLHMNTDVHLTRWLRANKNKPAETADKFRKYLQIRKGYRTDEADFFHNFYEKEDTIKFRQLFSQSEASLNWVNSNDNALVFVESAVKDIGSVTKSIRVNDYARIFFGYCEFFQDLVLKQEAKSGKESYGICIFDMSGFSLMSYANPVSAINKMYESRIDIWLNYYSELLKKVVIVNGPRLMSIVWKVLSILLPSHVHDRFTFANSFPGDFKELISLDAIPVAFGGTKVMSNTLSNCCNKIGTISSKEYKKNGEIWQNINASPPPADTITLSSGEKYTKIFTVQQNQKLLYEFMCNRDYTLKIVLNEKHMLNPDIKLSTPVLAAEDCFIVAENGSLVFEITNASKLMSLSGKLKLSVI